MATGEGSKSLPSADVELGTLGTSHHQNRILEKNDPGLSPTTADPLSDSAKSPLNRPDNSLVPTSPAVIAHQRWNYPRVNVWRTFGTFYSFIIMGGNDAAFGALIPYLEKYYNADYTTIACVFLSPMAGYILCALFLDVLHVKFGQRGIAMIGCCAHILAYVAACNHPPYPALVIMFIFSGFANGTMDGAWNAWLGDMENPNEILGILHAFYGVGAALAPSLATSLITKAGWRWYEYYYIMLGASLIELIFLTWAFWSATGEHFREHHMPPIEETSICPSLESSKKGYKKWLLFGPRTRDPNSRIMETLTSKVVWLGASFLLVYMGVEVAMGGWTTSFMLNVRHASAFSSGMSSTGFWLGITVGRVVLGFVTPRAFANEKWAITTYLIATIGLVLIYWLVPKFMVSAVAVALVGFFIAPLFPAVIVVMTKLLPKRMHVTAISFIAATGASGACAFPFLVGAIATAAGVWVLMPIVIALVATDLAIWFMIPKLPKVREV